MRVVAGDALDLSVGQNAISPVAVTLTSRGGSPDLSVVGYNPRRPDGPHLRGPRRRVRIRNKPG